MDDESQHPLADVRDPASHRAVLHGDEQRFQQIADAMPQIVWGAGPDGVLDYYNRRWFEYIDLPESDTELATWHRHVHADDLPRAYAAWSASLASGAPYHIEFRVRRADGAYCWFLVRAQPVRDAASGAIVHWYGTCTDIEDRRRGEVRDRFLVALDEAGRTLTCADEITATYARLLGEHLGADRCAYADVEADQDTFNLTGDHTRGGMPSIVGRYRFADFGDEVLRRMRDDEPFVVDDVDAHAPPIADLATFRATLIQAVICVPLHKDGRFVAAMAVHQRVARAWTPDDVALVLHVANRCWESIERARVERTLRESESRFRTMADTMPQMVWITRADGYHEYYNRRWYEFTGLADGSTDGDGWNDVFHPDDQARAWAVWRRSLATGEPYEIEYRLRHHSGEYRWTLGRALAVRDARGEIDRWFGTCTDIDSMRKLVDERERLLASERAAHEAAEIASRTKDEFLATLSHELRTPLSAILGWSQLLRRPNAKPEVLAEGLNTIERNARAQTQIIDDLLDMSRIISGKISLDARRANLSAVVRAAIETVRPTATAKQTTIRYDEPADARHPILGDFNRLQQVFWNLLSNAIKFTPRAGEVVVRVEQRHSQWQVDVIDSGEGIGEAFLPFVFDRFRQADASTTRKHGGLGLGLAIVKQLVELHGGSVRARSDGAGRGCTFTVSLPVSVVHDGVAEPARAASDAMATSATEPAESTSVRETVAWDASLGEPIRGRRVVIVDDEPDARALLRQVLEQCGVHVRLAANADEAVALIEAEVPDLLVSDIGMPGTDGYALIRRVRALGPARGGAIPAIALTAYARADDRMKAIRAGFQMHVPKPVEPAELLTMIGSLIGLAPS